LPEVTPREFPTGSRLKVPLERQRRPFLVELDDDELSPGAMA
jgi:hypothetical protein